MDIQQLEFFIAAAKYEHLSHAAETLNISQSSLSYAINQLESELGVKLFDRVGRNIRLNQAGITFRQYAIEILQSVTEAQNTLRTQYCEENRPIVIQTTPMFLLHDLFDQLYTIEQNIEILPIGADTPFVLANNLLQMKTDLCITPFELTESGLNSAILSSDEIIALVSKEHPLANESSVSIDRLKSQQFISGGTLLTSIFLNILSVAGKFTPTVKCKTATHEESLFLLKKMPYVYLSSKNIYQHLQTIADCSDVCAVELDTPAKIFQRKLYWRKKNNPPIIRKLCDILTTYFENSETER